MKTPRRPFARRLARDEFLRIERPERLCLRAERGTLWITIDGEPDDIELDAGMSRVFHRTPPLTVGVLGRSAALSAVPLVPPVQRWWTRLWRWPAQWRHGFQRIAAAA